MIAPQQYAGLTRQERERICAALNDVERRARAGEFRSEKDWAIQLCRAVGSKLAADLYIKHMAC
jgi:hypothetical protein